MSDQTAEAKGTPGIVIFVAVLNFIGSFFLFFLAVICLVFLVFGNAAGFYDAVTKQVNQAYAQYNLSIGLNVLFGAILAVGLFLAVFYLLVGMGLLKGRKLAWYFQIALSAIGVISFPFGTVINIIILIFFFQQNIRTHFKV